MTNKLTLGFKRLNENATIPTKAHANDSGFDLYASEDVIIEPGETAVVPTGIAVQLPEGTEAVVRPRSGVTSKTKLRVQLGTIDRGYSGEIGVIVDNARGSEGKKTYGYYRLDDEYRLDHRINAEKGSYLIRKHDKLAQLVIQELPRVIAEEVFTIDKTDRGESGFGSTGV